MEESKRIKKLKKILIKQLPFFPNNKETLVKLENQSLNAVLLHYLHWKTRIVPPRPRKIQIAPEVTSDKRWKSLKPGINDLLDKVRKGEDIYPYHSERAHKKGYTPARIGQIDSWEDKDQLLNTKGFHHFHLNMNVQNTGLSERTDDVLFAFVSRDIFHAIGIFDHSVFESTATKGSLTNERERMLQIHENYTTIGMAPETKYYISNVISTSGHPLYLVRMCDHYAHIIHDIDPKLDDRTYIKDILYAEMQPPNNFNFIWQIDHLDLGIFDKQSQVFFKLYNGHM